jgi:hypothetical protein
MKISLDENDEIIVSVDKDKKASLSLKTKKDNGYILISAKLNRNQLDDLITNLVSLKLKVKE